MATRAQLDAWIANGLAVDKAQLRQLLREGVAPPWVDVASAATVTLAAAGTAHIRITGTTSISSFGTADEGTRVLIRFAAALTLVNGANLSCPGGVSMVVEPNAEIEAVALAGNVWVLFNYTSPALVFSGGRMGLNTSPLVDALLHLRAAVGGGTWRAAVENPTLGLGQARYDFFTAVANAFGILGIDQDAGGNASAILSTGAGVNLGIAISSGHPTAPIAFRIGGTERMRVTPAGLLVNNAPVGIQRGAAVAATGVSVDFGSIPAGVSRITLLLDGVSTSGTSLPCVLLGDSGGIETTGYAGHAHTLGSAAAWTTSTTHGVLIANQHDAADLYYGRIVIELVTGNTWVITSQLSDGVGFASWSSWRKAVSPGPLDRVRLTTVGGADTFDAGTINILWE